MAREGGKIMPLFRGKKKPSFVACCARNTRGVVFLGGERSESAKLGNG